MNAHWEYLQICAWCKPLGKLMGSHGICPRHLAEQMATLLSPAATPRA